MPAALPYSRQMLRACQCFILQLIHTFRFSNRLSSAVIPHSRSSFVLLFPWFRDIFGLYRHSPLRCAEGRMQSSPSRHPQWIWNSRRIYRPMHTADNSRKGSWKNRFQAVCGRGNTRTCCFENMQNAADRNFLAAQFPNRSCSYHSHFLFHLCSK